MAQHDDSSAAAFQELRETLAAQNPQFLAQCENISQQIIDNYKPHGDSGKVLLMFLALRISAMAEKDEF